VIDACAFQGMFVKQVLNRASKVLAIEPSPQNLCWLRAIAERHKNVDVVPYALWNEPCVLTLNLCEKPYLDSVFNFSSERIIKKIKVKAVTLDSLTKNFDTIGFLKMDIEGAEIEALKGAEETLQKTKKVVIASYHIREGCKTKKFVVLFLKSRGFHVITDETDIVYGIKTHEKLNSEGSKRY